MASKTLPMQVVEEIFSYLPRFIGDEVFNIRFPSPYGYGPAKPPKRFILSSEYSLDEFYSLVKSNHGSDRLITNRYYNLEDVCHVVDTYTSLKNVPLFLQVHEINRIMKHPKFQDLLIDVKFTPATIKTILNLPDVTLNLYKLDLSSPEILVIKNKIKSAAQLIINYDQLHLVNDLHPKYITICIHGNQDWHSEEFSHFGNYSITYYDFQGNLNNLHHLTSLTLIRRSANEENNYNLSKLVNLHDLQLTIESSSEIITKILVGALTIQYPQNLVELSICVWCCALAINDYNWPPQLKKLILKSRFGTAFNTMFYLHHDSISDVVPQTKEVNHYQFPKSLESLELANVTMKFTNLGDYSNLKSLWIGDDKIKLDEFKLPENMEIFHFAGSSIDKLILNNKLIDLEIFVAHRHARQLNNLIIPSSVKFVSLRPTAPIHLPKNVIASSMYHYQYRISKEPIKFPNNIETLVVNFSKIDLSQCNRLTYLIISRVHLTDELINQIPKSLKHLQFIELANQWVSYIDLSMIGLESLKIVKCLSFNFTFKFPKSLKYLIFGIRDYYTSDDICCYDLTNKLDRKKVKDMTWTRF